MIHGRQRTGQGPVAAALIAGCLLGLAGVPARAIDEAAVDRYIRLSDAFHARLSNSPLAGLPPSAIRARAVCILTRFEDRFGSAGVADLMDLMNVLSRGAEFDDPTIIAFNDRYGPVYDRTERECTGLARGA